MSNQDFDQHNYIFFLQLGEKLPKVYLQLSSKLAKYGITLVPVRQKQLVELQENTGKSIVVTIADNIKAYKYFRYLRQVFIDFTLLNGRMCLIDLSSFERVFIPGADKKKFSYYYYRLPMKTEHIISEIVEIFYNERKENKKWPGGKRVKLSSLVSSN